MFWVFNEHALTKSMIPKWIIDIIVRNSNSPVNKQWIYHTQHETLMNFNDYADVVDLDYMSKSCRNSEFTISALWCVKYFLTPLWHTELLHGKKMYASHP